MGEITQVGITKQEGLVCKIKRKTKSEFVLELKTTHPNIVVHGDYINNKIPIKCECIVCNNVWYPRPDQLVRGQNCPICGIKKRQNTQSKKHKVFEREVSEVNDNLTVISKYKNNHTKVLFKCKTCKCEFEATPNNVLCGSDCPNCYGTSLKSQEEYEKDMKLLYPNIRVIGSYLNNKTPVEVECLKCNNVWYSYPTNALYQNRGCPRCDKKYKGEVKISQVLKDYNICFEEQKTFTGLVGVGNGNLKYDFYIDDLNLLIEYQGNFHDGSGFVNDFFTEERLKIQQEHDRRKREYANIHNIKLLEIWYWDYGNIEEILKEKLNKGEY